MTFGADIIAGFPTETEAHVRQLAETGGGMQSDWLHVFPYSSREGTPAAKMPAVKGPDIKHRAAKLRALGSQKVAHISKPNMAKPINLNGKPLNGAHRTIHRSGVFNTASRRVHYIRKNHRHAEPTAGRLMTPRCTALR